MVPWQDFASRLLTKLLRRSKRFIGRLTFGMLRLIAICTTAAVTGVALQTSIQTHNFIQNWTKDAYTMWATQAQIDEDIQDEIQELKTAIKWVGDQLIDVQKQVMLKWDWNSTQFCVAAVAAAKSLQSCPTLCDPIDGSPPGSPIPGILQARTLEWVAIAFSNA